MKHYHSSVFEKARLALDCCRGDPELGRSVVRFLDSMTQIQLLREPTGSHQCQGEIESWPLFLSPPLPAWPSPDIPGSASFPGSHSPQPVSGELPQAKHMLLSSIALIHLQRGGIIARVAMDLGRFCPSLASIRLAYAARFNQRLSLTLSDFINTPPPSLSKRGRGTEKGKRKPDSEVQLHCVTGEGGNL